MVFPLLLAVLLVGAARLPAQLPQGSAAREAVRLRGVVRDTVGAPIAGAEVLAASGARTVAGDSGRFEVVLPDGPAQLTIRRLGFKPVTFDVSVSAGDTTTRTFALSATPAALPGVTVEAETDVARWLRTFNARRENGTGRYITRQDIEKRSPRIASDLLRGIPGMSVSSGPSSRGGSGTVFSSHGGRASRCAPQVFVHGTPFSGTIDDFTPDAIEALEIYSGSSSLPPELNIGRSGCGAIVIWTRAPQRKAKG